MRGQVMGSRIPFTGAIKALVIANLSIWLVVQVIIGKLILGQGFLITQYLGLVPQLIINKFFVWQVFTYQFLHSFLSMKPFLFYLLRLFYFVLLCYV